MTELKTKLTNASVAKFLGAIEDKERRTDCKKIAEMMAAVTKAKAKMWGSSIVGFGEYHYTGKSSEGEWFMVGFAPRKKEISVYLMGGLGHQTDFLAKSGKYKTGKGCLYINKLQDIDLAVLTKMTKAAVAKLKKG